MKTKKILLENKFLYHDFVDLNENQGKGFAIHQGLKKVKGDIVLVQDADLEYDPADYHKLLEPFKDRNIHCVYGSRVLPGANRTRPKSLSFAFRTFANHFLTFLSNLLNVQKLTDAHTCYKVFDLELVKSLTLVEKGFDFCPEITAKVSKKNVKIHEVPISYNGRTHREGKKSNLLMDLEQLELLSIIIFFKMINKNDKIFLLVTMVLLDQQY